MPTCVLVIGTPRSGTSLVAGVLHHLGVRMGEYIGKDDDGVTDRWDWCGPDEWNGKGHFADAAIGNWGTDVFGLPPWAAREVEEAERERLAFLIRQRKSFIGDWGVKHHILPWFAEEVAAMAETQVKLIVTHRESERSAASWSARSGDSLDKAREIVAASKKRIAEVLESLALQRLLVTFDRLVDRSEDAVRDMAEFVGREATSAALEFPDAGLRRF